MPCCFSFQAVEQYRLHLVTGLVGRQYDSGNQMIKSSGHVSSLLSLFDFYSGKSAAMLKGPASRPMEGSSVETQAPCQQPWEMTGKQMAQPSQL